MIRRRFPDLFTIAIVAVALAAPAAAAVGPTGDDGPAGADPTGDPTGDPVGPDEIDGRVGEISSTAWPYVTTGASDAPPRVQDPRAVGPDDATDDGPTEEPSDGGGDADPRTVESADPGGDPLSPPPPCPNPGDGVGELTMPSPMVTPGAIFSPATDSFVGDAPAGTGRPVHDVGDGTPTGTGADPAPQFRTAADGEELRVRAHFWDDWQDGPQFSMARVVVESLSGTTTRTYPFWTVAGGFTPHFKCYADDTSAGSNRFYMDVWVPLTPAIVAEPGFNVRVQVLSANGAVLHDGDQNAVHVGPVPTSPGTEIAAALGLALDDDILVDTDGTPDDLESILRAELTPTINSAVHELSGLVVPINNSEGEQKGEFKLNQAQGSSSLDLDLRPTTTGSTTVTPPLISTCFSAVNVVVPPACVGIQLAATEQPSGPDDDEHRLFVEASLDASLAGQIIYSPIGADWEVSGTIDLTFSVGVDVADDRLSVLADLRLEDIAIDLDAHEIDIWQWLFDILVNEEHMLDVVVDLLENDAGPIGDHLMAGSLGDTIAATVNDLVAEETTGINDVLGSGVPVGVGGFGLAPLRWQDTCDPLGCDGYGAGDVLLWERGMDVVVSTAATDLGPDRFPRTYDPVTADVAAQVHDRVTDDGGAFDIGLHIDAALLNQALTGLGSSGILDISADLGGVAVATTPEVAPVFVPTQQLGLASPGDAPLALLLPNLQVELAGGARFAVEVAAGVDAAIDAATGELVPDAQVALNINVLACPGGELACGLLTSSTLLDAFEQFVNEQVVAPLLAGSIGQIAVPQLLGVQLGSAHLAQLGGNVAVFVDVIPTPRVSLVIDGDHDGSGVQSVLQEVTLDATPTFFPGSGDHVAHWTVRDQSGATVYSSPVGGEPDLELTLDVDDMDPQPHGEELSIVVDATVVVERAGASAEASGSQWFWWFDPDGNCPPMC